jgi:hypothetical protein
MNAKQLAALQLLIGLIVTGIAGWLSGVQLAASIAVGAGLMLLNLSVIAWSWQRLMDKKSVAWTTLIIVIKYAVLLGSIVFFARTEWFNPLGAGIGIATFMISALILAGIYFEKKDSALGTF